MKQRELIEFLGIIEKLKCNTRHSWTSTGRQESVADHCWRLSVMALLLKDIFPHVDINKTIIMCLIHDLGEAITKDIPAFEKTELDEDEENKAIEQLLSLLPKEMGYEFADLFDEMNKHITPESKLFKALDNMEAVISHNEAPLSTWLPLEYEENLHYGTENAAYSDYLGVLREEIKQDTLQKIEKGL